MSRLGGPWTRLRVIGRGQRHLVAAFVVLGTAVAMVVPGLGIDRDAGRAEAAATPHLQVQLGPEEYVFGPSNNVDTPYSSFRDAAGRLHGLTGNNLSYVYDVASNGTLANERVALTKGGGTSFDACGAWMQGNIYQATATHWVAWYHAEAPGRQDDGSVACVYPNSSTVWRMAITESWDAGKTWHKPHYPNNKVITQDTTGDLTLNRFTEDTGNGRVLRIGDYLYMFYQGSTAADAHRRVNVARAPVSSLGRPGSWRKYYCGASGCGFTEPGLGGRSTPLPALPKTARSVTYSSYLGRYIAPQTSGRTGFRLWISTGKDPLHWGEAPVEVYPAVSTPDDPAVDKWGRRGAGSRQLYAYPALIGAGGSSGAIGQDFYLYYMKLFPGSTFKDRYLFRRKVSLSMTTATPHNRVALSTYALASGVRRSSTEAPRSLAYRLQSTPGWLSAQPESGWQELYECTLPGGDTILRPACVGSAPVRRVGWISPKKTAVASLALYQCLDPRLMDRFVSGDPKCGGLKNQRLLGYALPAAH